MVNTEKLMNQTKITARSLQRRAKKCEKDEKNVKVKVKKKIKKGNIDGAGIHAENAIRKRNEQMNYSVPVKINAGTVGEEEPSERLADLMNRGDWYILEKSKKVKPFRCVEYDESITKVKDAAASTGKKAVKYAQREDAILHALEIESARESKDSPNFSAGMNKQDGDQGDVDQPPCHLKPDKQTQDTSAESSIFDKNSVLAHELSQSGVSFEEPKHINPLKEQSAQGKRRKTPNDSEDDGTQATKRMRGLEDLGVGGVSSCKRKRTQVAYVHEFLTKKSHRRQLKKVLQSSKMTNVRVTCGKHSIPTESSLPCVSDSKVSGLESNESKRSLSSVIKNNSDSIGISCEDDASQNLTSVIVEVSLSKTKQKGSEISSMPLLIENDPSKRLFDVSFMRDENHPADVSSVLLSSASRKYVQVGAGEQSSKSSQIETLSVGNEEINESGFTSSGAADINNVIHNSIEKDTSKWKLKGKRDLKHKSKSKRKGLKKFVDMDIDYDSNTCMVDSVQKVNHYTVVGQVNETEADELRGWSIGHISHKVSSEGLAPQRLLPFRQSRFTINPKYQMSDFSFRSYEPGTLYDVDLEVKTSYRPQGVPYIALMSKLNGKPIIGHPLAIEILDDGFLSNAIECYKSSCQLDGVHLGGKRKASSSKGVDVVREVKPSNIRFSAKPSRASPSKSRKSGLLSKKIRKLSSLTGSQKLHEEEEKKVCMEKLNASSVACVPLKVVFSRINAALTHRVTAG